MRILLPLNHLEHSACLDLEPFLRVECPSRNLQFTESMGSTSLSGDAGVISVGAETQIPLGTAGWLGAGFISGILLISGNG